MASGSDEGKLEENLSDEVLQSLCFPCKRKNKQRAAVKFCVECRKLFCEDCLSQHDSVLDDHTLLDDITQCSFLKNQPTERCLKHDETVKMWCKSHDQVACTVCISIDHRSCDKVVPIPTDIDNILKQSDVDRVVKDLVGVKKGIEGVKEKSQAKRRNLEKNLNESLQAVIDNRQKIDKILDKLDEKANEEIKSRFEKANSKIQNYIKSLESARIDIEISLKQIEASSENASQLFVCMKKGQNRLTDARAKLDDTHVSDATDLQFIIDKSLQEYLSSIESIGCMSNNNHTRYKMESMSEVNVQIKEDTKICYISDICQLDWRSFIMTDIGNKRLKRLDINSCTIQDHCDFECNPYSVCRLGDNVVAVSHFYSSVSILSTSPNLHKTHSVDFGHTCWGLALLGEELLVSNNSKTVYFNTLDGKPVRKVDVDQDNTDMFKQNRHLAVDEKRGMVYVTDHLNGVVCMGITGRKLTQYSDPELKSARGVCLDGAGNIFVSGQDSNNVLQLGWSGQSLIIVSEVISPNDGIKEARSVVFDRIKCQLIVTKSDCNTVTMCKLNKT